ncbi:MAG: hypothetical protein LBE14_08515 [Treponema sp.]|jgi:hypothetical protein|nr:hypothetical protein [Treponema sp.]
MVLQKMPPGRINPGGGKKQKYFRTSPRVRGSLLIPLLIVLALATGGGLTFGLTRPRPVWYVDEFFVQEWGRFLRGASPPFRRFETIPSGEFPSNRYGFIISPRLAAGFIETEDPGGGPRIFPWLSRTLEYKGALAVAANPWLVFRKHQVSGLPRNRVDSIAGGEGMIILPGGEPDAVKAWLSQLLQETPGEFPRDPGTWKEAEETLFAGRRFQNGAMGYHWLDVWPLLLREEKAWVYAPINKVRELSSYRMGLLEAGRFPEKSEWSQFGIQADVLWAMPFGAEKQRKKLAAAEGWLKDPLNQTTIANAINWVPAHPEGVPYNPVTWEAQVAWIMSSFVWQGPE